MAPVGFEPTTSPFKWITVKLRPSRFRQDMAAGKKQHGLGFICPRDNPILSTPSTNSNTISLSPRLLRKFGRGRGNRTPGGPCERTPVFRTGDFANSSTPLHDLAETAGTRTRSLRSGQALHPCYPYGFSKALRCRFRTHLHNPVRERRLELPRPKAAVFRTAVAASFTTRAKLVCRPGFEPGRLRTALSTPPVCQFQHRHERFPKRSPAGLRQIGPRGGIRTPIGLCARCVLSAVRVPVPPRAETWRTARRIELRIDRFAQAARSPFPCRPQSGGLSRI